MKNQTSELDPLNNFHRPLKEAKLLSDLNAGICSSFLLVRAAIVLSSKPFIFEVIKNKICLMPLFLKKFGLLLPVLGMCLVFSCKKDDPLPDGKVEAAMLDSVNKLRITGCTCGNDVMPAVPALNWNVPLTEAAAAHAKDMSRRNYFEHISPEGTSPIQRAAAAGYSGTSVLENIGKGYAAIAAVIAAWKGSESHCKAMMDPLSKDMGAYSYNGFWVQEFGR